MKRKDLDLDAFDYVAHWVNPYTKFFKCMGCSKLINGKELTRLVRTGFKIYCASCTKNKVCIMCGRYKKESKKYMVPRVTVIRKYRFFERQSLCLCKDCFGDFK